MDADFTPEKERDRAEREAARITAYWNDRGLPAPTITIIPLGYDKQMRTSTWGLRSNMKNGLPVQVEEGVRHG